MAEDIAPELLKKIQEEFHKNCSSNKELQEISKKVADGTANCEDLENYAIAAGEMLAKAMHDNVSGDILPDGKMYYNIASRILPPNLEECHAMVADIAEGIYGILNEKAGIHIKALRPDLNKDRIDGLVNYVSNADQYEDVRKSTEQSMVTFGQSVATDAVHKNADFQYKAGLTPKIRRRAEGNCCKWCQSLEGTYDYADVRDTGNDVWRRHRDCRCEVTYDPGTGKVQDAHSKEWSWKEENKEKVAERKKSGLEQEYRPTTRGEDVLQDGKFRDVKLRRATEYDNEIYLSEAVSIKPRALYNFNADLTEAIKAYGGNQQNRPRIAVISQAEIGEGRVALYDPVSNTIYAIPEVGDHKKIIGFQTEMTCKTNPRATMYHETWHWMQAEDYRKHIGIITDESKENYIEYASNQGKKRLDEAGVDGYNVTQISDYAARRYARKRYDEVDAELHVKKILGR